MPFSRDQIEYRQDSGTIMHLHSIYYQQSIDAMKQQLFEEEARKREIRVLTAEQQTDDRQFELAAKMRSFDSEIEQLKSMNAKLMEDKSKAVDQYVETTDKLQQAYLQYNESLDRQRQLQKDRTELEATYQNLLNVERQKSQRLESGSVELRKQLDECLSTKESALANVQDLENQISKLRNAASELANGKKSNRSDEKVQSLEKKLKESEKIIKDLNSQLVKVQDSNRQPSSTKAGAKSSSEEEAADVISGLEGRLRESESELKTIKSENTKLLSRAEKTEAELAKTKVQLQAKIDGLEKKLKAATAKKNDKNASVSVAEPALLFTPESRSAREQSAQPVKRMAGADKPVEQSNFSTTPFIQRRAPSVPLRPISGNLPKLSSGNGAERPVAEEPVKASAATLAAIVAEDLKPGPVEANQPKRKRKLGLSKKPLLLDEDRDSQDMPSTKKSKVAGGKEDMQVVVPVARRASAGGKLISPLKKRNESLRDMFKL